MRTDRLLIAVAAVVLSLGPARAQPENIYGVNIFGDQLNLVRFNSNAPAAFTSIGSISGISAGQTLRGVDYRPATGEIYGIGTVGTSTVGQLYTINRATAVATVVGPALSLTGNTSDSLSIDFDPVTDTLRVVTGSDQDFTINPTTAAVTPNGSIKPPGRGITGIAYSNNVSGAASTTLYAVDYLLDDLSTIPVLNDGTLVRVGDLNIGGTNVSQFTKESGFDISGASGVAYFSMDRSGSASELSEFYTMDLASGQLSLVAQEIPGLILLDFTVAPVPEPATVGLVAVAGLGFVRLARRKLAKSQV